MNVLLQLLGLESGSRVDSVARWYWRSGNPLPAWLVYFIAIVGVLIALVNFLPQLKMRLSVRVWTFFLRLGMVALLLGLFQQVELHLRLKLQQKQRWVVLVDDSASMATEDEGGRSRYAAAIRDIETIRRAVGARVDLEVKSLSGAPVKDEPGRGPTLIERGFSRAVLSTSGIDRVVFLTDGRDTEARDLTRLGKDIKARGVGLDVRLYGSSSPPRDAGILAEPERSVLRLGEELVIRGSITAKDGAGSYAVELKEDGKTVKQLSVPAESSRQFIVTYKPAQSGRHIYSLELPGRDSLAMNNVYTFKADVVQEKIKVFMIEGFPRYEFKLWKVALEVDPMVDLTTLVHIPGGGVYVQGKPLHRNLEQGLISSQADLFKYDVVILRDVSRQYFRAGGDTTESRLRNIVEFVTKRGGGLVVLGGQDVFRAGGYEDSSLAEILPFDLSDYFSAEAQFEGMFFAVIPKTAYSHPILRIFADPARNKERLNSLRELDGSNNVGRFKPLAVPLMTRFARIKTASGEFAEKEVPIMAYQAVGDGKVVAAAVDTFWRWQLQPDFDDPPLQAIAANIVRYIAPPARSRPGAPTINMANPTPQVGQQLLLSTTLKDKNYDPVRNADLVVTVVRPDKSQQHLYPRDLPEQPGYYEYRVELDMPGAYEVKARWGKEESDLSFFVEAAGTEYADLSADREGMRTLCRAADGRIVDSIDSWLKAASVRPSTRDAVRDLQVWNSPLMLLLFFLLVCADCYVRKRQGLA